MCGVSTSIRLPICSPLTRKHGKAPPLPNTHCLWRAYSSYTHLRVHGSPSETQSEPKDTLIDTLPAYATGAGYRREPTKVSYASVAVQLHVRDIGAGVIEVRCIGEVECFSTELQSYVFREPKFAEDSEIDIHEPRAAQKIESCGSEPRFRNRLEG